MGRAAPDWSTGGVGLGSEGGRGQVFGALYAFLRLDAQRRGLPESAAASLFERMQREVPREGGGGGRGRGVGRNKA